MARPAVLVVAPDSVAQAKAPVSADRLRAPIEKSFDVAEMITAEMGPAALFQPTEEELPLVAPLSDPARP